MKAISLWQPWATLWAAQLKKYETRAWPTYYRGPLAVHASKKLVIIDEPEFREALNRLNVTWDDLPLGAIVGYCNRIGCRPITQTMQSELNPMELAFGDYTPGRWMWVPRSMKLLQRPIPLRGSQGLFNPTDNIIRNLADGYQRPWAMQKRLF